MKKILLVILGLILMLTTVSCGDNGKDVAKQDFENSMEALKKGDFSGLNMNKETVEALQMFTEGYKKMTYTINKVTEADGKVLVNVTMKYPNLAEVPAIHKEVMTQLAPSLQGKSNEEITNKSKEALKATIDEALKDSDLKYAEETFDVIYVKDGKEWKVADQGNEAYSKAVTFNFQQ